MRLWFRRHKANDGQARGQGKKKQSRPNRRSKPPTHDPIKNWETPDQAFLRQAGDPFDDG
jgi:hypothetical protein